LTSNSPACSNDNEIPPSCVAATQLSNNTVRNSTLNSNTGEYYYIDIPPFTSFYTFSSQNLGLGTLQQTPLDLYVGYQSVPTNGSYYQQGVGNVTVSVPPAGRYYVYAFNKNAVPFNYSSASSLNVCTQKFGPDCSITADFLNPNAKDTLNITELANKTATTYRIQGGQSIRISVAALPQADSNDMPSVWVRKNNLPDSTKTYLNSANDCNIGPCSRVVQIYFPQTSLNDVYFVTIQSKLTQQTQYAIWLQDVCALNCSRVTSSACLDSGVCQCPPDASATFYCGAPSPKTPLPIEYVVLIVIGCLVVLSAIIGFIAWAYMRRKRIHYEKV
jgi:hypothetical protein